jgi:hypothetical protein
MLAIPQMAQQDDEEAISRERSLCEEKEHYHSQQGETDPGSLTDRHAS